MRLRSAGESGAPVGQMTGALMKSMQGKITEALEAKRVSVEDVYGDGRYRHGTICSKDNVSPWSREGKIASLSSLPCRHADTLL